MQCFKSHDIDLIHDAVLHGKPVQGLKHWSDVGATFTPGDNSGGKLLHFLKAVDCVN